MQRLLRLFVLLLCIGPAAVAIAADKIIHLATAPGGFAPYVIVAPGQPVTGIMADVLREVGATLGYRIEGEETPKNRVEQMIAAGLVDAAPRAKEWMTDSRGFVFTDPVVRVRDVVFSRRVAPVPYRSPDDLVGKTVGAHLGYSYPVLAPYFDAKRIVREDARTELAMLRMLQAGRTDVLVMNEAVAQWLIKTEKLQGQFIAADTELDGYDYRFMFGHQWSDFVPKFNQELARMKKDGRLARILNKYRMEPTR